MKLTIALLASLLLLGCKTPITITLPTHFPTNVVVQGGTNIIFQRKATRMSLPDGSYAPIHASVPKVIVPVANPFNKTVSFVATKADPGVLYTLNGLDGMTLTNALLFVTPKTIKLMHLSPLSTDKMRPARFSVGGTPLVILPDRPVMDVSWSPWDTGINVVLIDSTNLVAGKTYSLQASVDMVNWNGTGQSITWTSSDPTAYWRAVRAVPSDTNFVEVYRVSTP